MKRLLLVLSLFAMTSLVHADPTTINSSVTYKCSSGMDSIIGSDSSNRSCWPYICIAESDTAYSVSCRTYCDTSDQCQGGTVCDTKSSSCVKTN